MRTVIVAVLLLTPAGLAQDLGDPTPEECRQLAGMTEQKIAEASPAERERVLLDALVCLVKLPRQLSGKERSDLGVAIVNTTMQEKDRLLRDQLRMLDGVEEKVRESDEEADRIIKELATSHAGLEKRYAELVKLHEDLIRSFDEHLIQDRARLGAAAAAELSRPAVPVTVRLRLNCQSHSSGQWTWTTCH